MLLQHDKQLYTVIDAGPWRGLAPTRIDDAPPVHRWRGAKISCEHWRAVSAFLRWTQDTHGKEAVVHLYYSEKDNQGPEEIIPVVLPQELRSGLSVAPLPDEHPEALRKAYASGALKRREWHPIGSVHHHCTASAFQSGTDRADEANKDGLHITLGHLDRDRYSWHARVVWRGTQTDAVLSDWIDLPDWARLNLPSDLVEQYLALYLGTPVESDFPQHWRDQLRLQPERPPLVWVSAQEARRDTTPRTIIDDDDIASSARELCELHNLTMDELANDLAQIDDYTAELCTWCHENDLYPDAAAAEVLALARADADDLPPWDTWR